MFEKIARFSVKFRWFIIVFWILAIPILSSNLPKIADVSKNNNSDFLPKSTPSSKAIDLETAFQSKDTSDNAVIIASRDGQPLTDSDNQAIDRISAQVRKTYGVNAIRDQGVSADGQARQIIVGIGNEGFGDKGTQIVKDIRSELHKNVPTGLQLNLTGDFAASTDAENANNSGKDNTQIYTVIFILALLLFVFRALLAPIITLIPAVLALTISQPLIAESTKIGVQVSFITQILLIVLILGAGTDYGLFLVFRVREELRRGAAPKDAVVKALSKVGESITFSAATVAAALLSLLLASFGIYKGLGPALAIGLIVMLVIALTFLPALLAILGRAVFWPSKTKMTEAKIGLWGKFADKVIQRPKTMIVLGVLIFGSLTLGILGYKTSGFDNGSAPKGTDSAVGQSVVDKHFPSGKDNPQLLLFKFSQPVWNNLQVIAQAQSELASSGKFKTVSGPFNANGFKLTPASLQKLHEEQPNSPVFKAIAQFISSDGKTVQLYATSTAGASGGTAASNATPANRVVLAKVTHDVGAKDSAIFGVDAIGYDIKHTASHDLEKIIPLVLLIIAALLALMLRSLVAPWYLILTVGLSYMASIGFAMIVFVHLGHQDGLNFILPFMMFIFCMALGEDYNILVMSRIREEAHKEKTLAKAVTKAVGITGTTVTSAGLILAGTFGVLGLVGGNQQIEQIGYSIAFGILLDTFFVRTLLVPSIVALLGRWNWWPSKLYHDSK